MYNSVYESKCESRFISNPEVIYFVVIDYDIYLQRASEYNLKESISLKNHNDNFINNFCQKHCQNMTKIDAH